MNFQDEHEREFWCRVYAVDPERGAARRADAAVEALRDRAPLVPDPMGLAPHVRQTLRDPLVAPILAKLPHGFDFAEWWDFEAPWDHHSKRSAAEYAWFTSDTNTIARIAQAFDDTGDESDRLVALRIRGFK